MNNLNNFNPAEGHYLQVINSSSGEQLTIIEPSNWRIVNFVRKILMYLGLHAASMKKVAQYLHQHQEAEIPDKPLLLEKLTKYEQNHNLQFAFLKAVFGESNHHQGQLAKRVSESTAQGIPQPQNPEQDQKTISTLLQRVILPIYKMPMPRVATRIGKDDGFLRETIHTQFACTHARHCKRVEKKEVPARKHHGTMHAARVALWTQVLVEVYKRYGRDEIENPILLAAAGGFHDTAREAEGTDYWDAESGALFGCFLEKLGMNEEERVPYVQALVEKDPPNGVFTTDIQRIVHDADCLDIIRVRGPLFDPSYLCFWGFSETQGFNREQFIKEARAFIKITERSETRRSFEHDSENFYNDLIQLLFQRQKEFPLITSLMSSRPNV